MTTADPIASQQDLPTVPAAAVSESTGNVAVDALRERFAAQVKELTPDEILVYKTSGFRGAVDAILGRLGMAQFSSLVKGRNDLAERARLALEAQDEESDRRAA